MKAARALLTIVIAVGILTAFAAWAEQGPKSYRVGVLSTTLGPTSPVGQAFRGRLKELGYVEGRNLVIEVRAGGGSS